MPDLQRYRAGFYYREPSGQTGAVLYEVEASSEEKGFQEAETQFAQDYPKGSVILLKTIAQVQKQRYNVGFYYQHAQGGAGAVVYPIEAGSEGEALQKGYEKFGEDHDLKTHSIRLHKIAEIP